MPPDYRKTLEKLSPEDQRTIGFRTGNVPGIEFTDAYPRVPLDKAVKEAAGVPGTYTTRPGGPLMQSRSSKNPTGEQPIPESDPTRHDRLREIQDRLKRALEAEQKQSQWRKDALDLHARVAPQHLTDPDFLTHYGVRNPRSTAELIDAKPGLTGAQILDTDGKIEADRRQLMEYKNLAKDFAGGAYDVTRAGFEKVRKEMESEWTWDDATSTLKSLASMAPQDVSVIYQGLKGMTDPRAAFDRAMEGYKQGRKEGAGRFASAMKGAEEAVPDDAFTESMDYASQYWAPTPEQAAELEKNHPIVGHPLGLAILGMVIPGPEDAPRAARVVRELTAIKKTAMGLDPGVMAGGAVHAIGRTNPGNDREITMLLKHPVDMGGELKQADMLVKLHGDSKTVELKWLGHGPEREALTEVSSKGPGKGTFTGVLGAKDIRAITTDLVERVPALKYGDWTLEYAREGGSHAPEFVGRKLRERVKRTPLSRVVDPSKRAEFNPDYGDEAYEAWRRTAEKEYHGRVTNDPARFGMEPGEEAVAPTRTLTQPRVELRYGEDLESIPEGSLGRAVEEAAEVTPEPQQQARGLVAPEYSPAQQRRILAETETRTPEIAPTPSHGPERRRNIGYAEQELRASSAYSRRGVVPDEIDVTQDVEDRLRYGNYEDEPLDVSPAEPAMTPPPPSAPPSGGTPPSGGPPPRRPKFEELEGDELERVVPQQKTPPKPSSPASEDKMVELLQQRKLKAKKDKSPSGDVFKRDVRFEGYEGFDPNTPSNVPHWVPTEVPSYQKLTDAQVRSTKADLDAAKQRRAAAEAANDADGVKQADADIQSSKQKLIRSVSPLIQKLAKKTAKKASTDKDQDLLQDAYDLAAEHLDTFDPDKGALTTHISNRVSPKLKDARRRYETSMEVTDAEQKVDSAVLRAEKLIRGRGLEPTPSLTARVATLNRASKAARKGEKAPRVDISADEAATTMEYKRRDNQWFRNEEGGDIVKEDVGQAKTGGAAQSKRSGEERAFDKMHRRESLKRLLDVQRRPDVAFANERRILDTLWNNGKYMSEAEAARKLGVNPGVVHKAVKDTFERASQKAQKGEITNWDPAWDALHEPDPVVGGVAQQGPHFSKNLTTDQLDAVRRHKGKPGLVARELGIKLEDAQDIIKRAAERERPRKP